MADATFDVTVWHRTRRYAALAGKPLTDEAVLIEHVVASRICEWHGCKREWQRECPVCRMGLELAQMVAKAAGASQEQT